MKDKRGFEVVQGQRVQATLDGAGKCIRAFQQLARAEDNRAEGWQVTLSPVYKAGVGTATAGMPAFGNPPTGAGVPVVRLTFGGGGVSFQTTFPYPVAGASFAVAGDNVMVEVEFQDQTTVFTENTKPAMVTWVKPLASVTARDPLCVTVNAVSGTAVGIFPFARAIIVGPAAAGATITVLWGTAAGGIQTFLVPADGPVRIPVPADAENVTITSSAGVFAAEWELAFT